MSFQGLIFHPYNVREGPFKEARYIDLQHCSDVFIVDFEQAFPHSDTNQLVRVVQSQPNLWIVTGQTDSSRKNELVAAA